MKYVRLWLVLAIVLLLSPFALARVHAASPSTPTGAPKQEAYVPLTTFYLAHAFPNAPAAMAWAASEPNALAVVQTSSAPRKFLVLYTIVGDLIAIFPEPTYAVTAFDSFGEALPIYGAIPATDKGLLSVRGKWLLWHHVE